MTRVDFYQLNDEAAHALLLTTCKLVRKALRAHSHIYIQVSDMRMADQLDDLLWSFDPDSFIPHVIVPRDAATDAPVAIGVGAAPELHADVLINLTDALPQRYAHFQRVLEMVPANAEQRQQARERFKHYKERGYPLQYHNLEKKAE